MKAWRPSSSRINPSIYSIYELLDCKEEPAQQNKIREHVTAIEGENLKHGLNERSLGNGSVFIILWRPESMIQAVTCGNECLHVELCGHKI